MSINERNEEEDFSGKYLTSNFLIKGLIRSFYRSVTSMCSEINAEDVLEVGCGAGFSTEYLARIFQDTHFQASEFLSNLAKEAKERNPDVHIEQESLYKLKRKDNSFDLVIALEVFEHLEEPEKALQEMKRVTSKYCLLSVPNEPLWRILNMCRLAYLKDFGNTPGHINHWSTSAFAKFIGKEFEVKKVHTSLPWNMILAEKMSS